MADETQRLEIQVKINKDTGQLEVVNADLKKFDTKIEQTASKTKQSTDIMTTAFKGLLPAVTAVTVLRFMSDSVKMAEDENQAFVRLKNNLEASNISWDKNRAAINEWAKVIQQSTRFADDQAIGTLEHFIRLTGDLTQATMLSKLAMDISVNSGKNLEITEGLIAVAIASGEQGMRGLKKEFKDSIPITADLNQSLEILQQKYGGSSEKANEFTDKVAKLSHEFENQREMLGNALIPVLTEVMKSFEMLGLRIASSMVRAGLAIKNLWDNLIPTITNNKKRIAEIQAEYQAALIEGEEYINKEVSRINGETTKTVISEMDKKAKFNIKNNREILEADEKLKKEQEEAAKRFAETYAGIEKELTKMTSGEWMVRLDETKAIYESLLASGKLNAEQLVVLEQWKNEKVKEITAETADKTVEKETWVAENKERIASSVVDVIGALGEASADDQKTQILDILETFIRAEEQKMLAAKITSLASMNWLQFGALVAADLAIRNLKSQIKAENDAKKAQADEQVRIEERKRAEIADQLKAQEDASNDAAKATEKLAKEKDKLAGNIGGISSSVESRQVTNYITIHFTVQALDLTAVSQRQLNELANKLKPVIDRATTGR